MEEEEENNNNNNNNRSKKNTYIYIYINGKYDNWWFLGGNVLWYNHFWREN
jgi:hypothetical protein